MALLDRLERKLGFLAIPHLTWVLVVGQALGFLSIQVDEEFAGQLFLVPALVVQGEVWRLASFLFMPATMNPIFLFFSLYLLVLMGNALESTWGTFRYTVFLGTGYVATVLGAFVPALVPGWDLMLLVPTTNAYLLSTVFLAFAALFPDFQLMLFFVLPVKIRWLALVTWGLYAYAFVTGEWYARIGIVAAVTNYALFFGRQHIEALRSGNRQRAHRARFSDERLAKDVTDDGAFHRCAVCGITDKTHPQMDFRYCDECEGQVGYCTEHIRAHTHVKTAEANDERRSPSET